jgi:hypothetical protein
MAKKSAVRTYKHSPNTAWRLVDGDAVILNLDSSEYFSLNAAGAMIWEKLGKGEQPDRIQAAVCEEFEVPPAKALADIADLIKSLSGAGLLLPA